MLPYWWERKCSQALVVVKASDKLYEVLGCVHAGCNMPPCCGDLVGHPALVNPGGKNRLMLDRVIYREIAPLQWLSNWNWNWIKHLNCLFFLLQPLHCRGRFTNGAENWWKDKLTFEVFKETELQRITIHPIQYSWKCCSGRIRIKTVCISIYISFSEMLS